MTTDARLYCPHAARIVQRLAQSRYCPVTPDSPRRRRRREHRNIWRTFKRNHPTFREAWVVFNATLRSEAAA